MPAPPDGRRVETHEACDSPPCLYCWTDTSGLLGIAGEKYYHLDAVYPNATMFCDGEVCKCTGAWNIEGVYDFTVFPESIPGALYAVVFELSVMLCKELSTIIVDSLNFEMESTRESWKVRILYLLYFFDRSCVKT